MSFTMLRSAVARRAAPAARRWYSAPSAGAPGETAFTRERRAVKEHAASSTRLWRNISLFVALPGLIAAGANAYYLWNQHWEHWSHLPPLEERTEYAYQNIRTKNFCWGDGDKTMFWNDKVNYHKKDKVV